MIHEMRLTEKPFNNILKGEKKYELRLYDEKRSKINPGDYIVFHKTTNYDEIIKVKVIGLLRYASFEDLFKDLDYNLIGPSDSLESKINHIRDFYSEEEEKQYGVLAIRVKLVEC